MVTTASRDISEVQPNQFGRVAGEKECLLTERVRKIKNEVLTAQRTLCTERSHLLTEYFKNSPLEPIDIRRAKAFYKVMSEKSIAIAGPGEPLANEETFETFRLVKDNFPNLHLCMSTNGLLLPEKLSLIHGLGISTMTVTMNTVDPNIGKNMYSYVRYKGKYYHGLEAAELLLFNQLAGIKGAVERGIVVKVNTVMCPSINDNHLVEVAEKARELGVYRQNIMPLIPQAKFAHLRRPTPAERKQA